MANADGPNGKGRVYEFMSNGGGAITTRMATVVLLSITLSLVGLMWNDLKNGQEQALRTLSVQGQSIAVNSTRIDAVQSAQHTIWNRLDNAERVAGDQGNRLTHLEACQPHCPPR